MDSIKVIANNKKAYHDYFVIEKLEAGIAIIKVRIVFKENDAKDYDIAEGYQAKMAEDLLKSYQEAALNNRKKNSDLSDEDF